MLMIINDLTNSFIDLHWTVGIRIIFSKVDFVSTTFEFNDDSMRKGGCIAIYYVLVSVSCPKALFHLESDNLFRITVVVSD